jgi:hypothetical protein
VSGERWRTRALALAPTLLLILLASAPLAIGARTLYLRDVLNSHLGLRTHLAAALRAGELPLVDPLRAGGQGLAGNPNALPFYPDNLLLLVASPLWQLNAHFWLHWLAAPLAMWALARAWGLAPPGAGMAAAVYAFSGFFLSQLNFYNGVAVAALAPALAAALVASATRAAGGPRRRALAAAGALWALLLLAGDPLLAAIALAGALLLALARGGSLRGFPWLAAAGALALGTLVAAPQLVELARLLPGSFRGFWGFGALAPGVASPGPRGVVELLLPLFFCRPDLGETWANPYFGGTPPLYFSLAPGALALALLAPGAGGRDRTTRALLALFAAAGAATFSGGLAGAALARLPGGELVRYPVKLALVAALAGALLAGRGLERALADAGARRALLRALALVAGAALVAALVFALRGQGSEPLLEAFLPRGPRGDALAALGARWRGVALVQAALALAALALVGLGHHRRGGLAALLLLHGGGQLLLLHPLVATDDAAAYRGTPALLARLPEGGVLAHGEVAGLFGRAPLRRPSHPDPREEQRLLQRRRYAELHSTSALLAGRRTELNPSPEGLDSFLVNATVQVMKRLEDAERLRVLAATGADLLLLPRPLAPAAREQATLLGVTLPPAPPPPLHLYRIEGALADAQLVGRVRFAPHVGVAIDAVTAPGFAPRSEAVVAGDAPPRDAPPGTVRVLRFAAESIEAEVDSPAGGVLVLRRAWLPIWRAEVDGAPAPVRIANLTRLAVEIPPGEHRVRLNVSRTPLRWALAGAALGALGLAAMAWKRRDAAV